MLPISFLGPDFGRFNVITSLARCTAFLMPGACECMQDKICAHLAEAGHQTLTVPSTGGAIRDT